MVHGRHGQIGERPVGPSDDAETGASLDHAVWFHRRARLDDWVLVDLVPHIAAGGLGWYTGAFYNADRVRIASLAQEALVGEMDAGVRSAHGRRAGGGLGD